MSKRTSSTKEWAASIADFVKRTETKGILAPAVLATALWELLVDATPVLSGLTRSNWRFGVNAVASGPVVQLSADEKKERSRNGDPLPRPDPPVVGTPRAGDVYYISNGTVDPYGKMYLWKIIYGTKSQPIPWVDLSIQQVRLRVPELLVAMRYEAPMTLTVAPT